MQPGTMGGRLRAVRFPLKKKKMGRHRGRPSHDARIPPFYAPGVDTGESARTGEGERGTADACSDIDLSLVSGLYAGKRRRRERISAWGGA
jgi:hypothetical protein